MTGGINIFNFKNEIQIRMIDYNPVFPAFKQKRAAVD